MVELPQALRPWSEQLSCFQPEMALMLAPWVQRVSLAMGPMRSLTEPGDGEPDGFEGLSRRGPYDRLLASEWLLSTEAPDEFLRRAASGEHAFLALARREPQGALACACLIDAGPDQLGSPRIAHLAALVALSRRAELAGAELRWAVLQSGSTLWQERVSASTLGSLLAARSGKVPSEAEARAWLDRLAIAHRRDEVWLVGGRAAARAAARLGASCLQIDEVVDPLARRLVVRARPAGRPAVDLELDLPEPSACVRLLRDPFVQAVAPPRKAPAPKAGAAAGKIEQLLFSASGRRLVMVARGRRVVRASPIPGSPRAAADGRIADFSVPGGEELVAAGWNGSRMQVVTEQRGQFLLRELGKRGGEAKAPASAPKPEGGEPAAGPISPLFLLGENRRAWLFVDRERRLEAVRQDGARPLIEGVVGLSPMGWKLLAAHLVGGDEPALRFAMVGDLAASNEALPIEVKGATGVLFGPERDSSAHPQVGLTAVSLGERGYTLFHSKRPSTPWMTDLVLPDGYTPWGTMGTEIDGAPSLLCSTPDRSELVAMGVTGRHTGVLKARGPIATAAVGPSLIGYATDEGEVVVFSLSYYAEVMRLLPGETR